ncbi:helix-turn-helix domain-containing protein [Streptomyces phaeochromogenes]|uniref:helix-turn-helix domain-containing protein n=1 Tax=Streptomyces phaeochromogenes TaxID=1923 RepID=UPI0033CAA8D7
MDKQNPSAPPCAQPRIPRGITHINVRHTTRFTVIGNHLAQHPELSGLAIGLAVHIQSLPTGARADIKTLAARFPEGETRIAAALRELEAHGYLARTRERLPSGRVVTHTVSYNRPRDAEAVAQAQDRRPTTPQSRPAPTSTPAPTLTPAPAPAPASAPAPVQPDAEVPPSPTPDPHPKNPPPAPEPHTHHSAAHDTATTLLASLHRDDPRLLLAERDVRRLAPAVTAWLDRGAAPEAVRRTLTASLPEDPLRHPAGLLAHRLAELLPPPLPAAPAARAAVRPLPLQNCDGCDRAFRARAPGRCRYCRSDLSEAA